MEMLKSQEKIKIKRQYHLEAHHGAEVTISAILGFNGSKNDKESILSEFASKARDFWWDLAKEINNRL